MVFFIFPNDNLLLKKSYLKMFGRSDGYSVDLSASLTEEKFAEALLYPGLTYTMGNKRERIDISDSGLTIEVKLLKIIFKT